MNRLALITCIALAFSCGQSATITGSSGGGAATDAGSGGGGGSSTATGGGTSTGTGGGTTSDGCADSAKIIYVVDSNRTFSSFDPATKQFRDLGRLNCPSTGEPFSMAVDRQAFAYVLYTTGDIFRVDTNGLGCTRTGFMPLAGHTFKAFGMGFSSNSAGSTSDTLYIAGGPAVSGSSQLATLNTSTFQPSTVGSLTGWPELTGTGDAKLWGFFPSSTPVVAQINKTDGTLGTTFSADSLAGNPNAWAFAFWGGRFWIFLKRETDASTSVYEMRADTGDLTTAVPDTTRHIVGAGVSTCAPLMVN